MLPRILAFAIPMVTYTALALVGCGLYRERHNFDRWILILIAGSFLTSLALRPNEHLLFFDEDIYTNIASNLSHAPVAQLTVLGGPGNIESSSYYKEPAGFPVLLSLAFLVAGTSELTAFILARLLYALATAAVYLLARKVTDNQWQSLTAAVVFAATPACFAFSASTGTDLTAALFATLFVWGMIEGNALLAVGALLMTSQVRLEMIALAPLLVVAPRISWKWKAGAAALLLAEILHVSWVLSIAPILAKAERVEAAFATRYIVDNLWINLKYLIDPRMFPLAIPVLAIAALFRRDFQQKWLLAWVGTIAAVYLLFYAGNFEINPRYSIQLTVPLIILAVSFTRHPAVLTLLAIAALMAGARPWQLPPYVQTLAADHRTAVEFARQVGPEDLVITGEPEIFMNHGKQAMNAVYATDTPGALQSLSGKYKRVFYYGGIRTNEVGNQQWEADRRVKSAFELHLVDAREFAGARIAIYELLQPFDRITR